MHIELFKKLEKSKWLHWVGMSPFWALPLYVMFNGKPWPGLGLLAFFISFYAGILLGGFLGRFVNLHFSKLSPDFGQRLSAALSAFGFLFLPVLVGTWTNFYLGTEIEMASVWLHFLWACVGGAIFFWTKPSQPGT